MSNRVFFYLPSDPSPSGGMSMIYRQVEVLCQHGVDACIVHSSDGFRFPHADKSIPVVGRKGELILGSSDVIVLPEVVQAVPEILSLNVPISGMESAIKVVAVQNQFLAIQSYAKGLEIKRLQQLYSESACLIGCSQEVVNTLRWLYPDKKCYRFRYAFDREPFVYSDNKSLKFCHMSRKRDVEQVELFTLLRLKQLGVGWKSVEVDGLPREEVAKTMQESLLFLSFAEKEGFGMPACEAMACGCVVLGYHGIGGREFFGNDFCRTVDEEDSLQFAKEMERLFSYSPEKLKEIGKRGSEWVRKEYSTEREVDSICKMWDDILTHKIELPDREKKMNTKVIIFHHGQPESADKLYVRLSSVFTDVELWDSGSPADKIPIHVTHALPNIYASGMWKKVLAEYANYDAVWIVCADVVLQDEPRKYKEALESCAPIGIWSPCIDGRAHPFMLKENYEDKALKLVRNVESQAMALGGRLLRSLKEIEGGKYGFGVDYWFCRKARDLGLNCIIDGRVSVYHPAGTGYNEQAAHDEMEKFFGEKYGKNFRQTLFQYEPTYEGNLMKTKGLGDGIIIDVIEEPKQEKKTMEKCLFTVDNGWGVSDFVSLCKQFPSCKKILMKKGVSPLTGLGDIEVIPYSEDLGRFADGNHIGVFHKIGPANFEDFKKLVSIGVPVVANVAYHRDVIQHEKTGFIYGDVTWASHWIRGLLNDQSLWETIKRNKDGVLPVAEVKPEVKVESISEVTPQVTPEVKTEESELVSVITPTFRREPRVVRRCVNCLQLQTHTNWEQLICSDGAEEAVIKDLVRSLDDKRVTYQHTTGKKPGDFGNTVRSEMLKKANGKYVMFCDDDNVIVPAYMEKMVKALKSNTEASFVICHVVHFGPLNEQEVGKAPKVLTGIPPKLFHIDSLQVLVKKEAMLDVGWDTEHGYIADGYSLQKLAEKYKYVELKEVLGFHL